MPLFNRIILASVLLILVACQEANQVTPAKNETKEASEAEVSNSKKGNEEDSGINHLYIGTGSVQGAYFPIGGVICRLLNRHESLHSLRCSLESTGGSINNLRQLREGRFDLVVAQSDWQYHAQNGTNTFTKDGPHQELRAVLALEPDPLALLVRDDSDIHSFDDLRGKTVSLGYQRSLQHRIVTDLLATMQWQEDTDFAEVRKMNDRKQFASLCAGETAAVLFLMSSLNDHLKTVPEDCTPRFIAIDGGAVTQTITDKPYYRRGKIPAGMYLETEEDIDSFGLGAVFVSTEETSPKAIYYIVKEIVENFRDFQSLHPSLVNLDRNDLPHAGITAPLHRGAQRYYREARLLK